MIKKAFISIFIPIFIVGLSLFALFPQTVDAGDIPNPFDLPLPPPFGPCGILGNDCPDGAAPDPCAIFGFDCLPGSPPLPPDPCALFGGDCVPIIPDPACGFIFGCDPSCLNEPNCDPNNPSPPPPPPSGCGECGAGCAADHRYRCCDGVNSVYFPECDSGPPPPPPPIADLMGPAVIEVPNPVILSWNSSNADSCSASGDWSGAKPTSGSETLNLPRGAYTFTLNCSGPGGSVSDSVTVNIIQVPQCTFWADPSSIIIPQTSSLRWTCQYADSCSIDQGVGSVCSSESECSGDLTKVRPKQTTAYVLTCGGLDGSRSYSATVNVGFIPKLKEIIPKLNFWYFKLVG